MNDTNRMITYFGSKPPRTIQRDVQKQLDKWIELKQGSCSSEKKAGYQVRFELNPSSKSCLCLFRIQIGGCTWEGYDVGKSIEESLHLALKSPTISFMRPEARVRYMIPAQENTGYAA
jgi:hypothetical protein